MFIYKFNFFFFVFFFFCFLFSFSSFIYLYHKSIFFVWEFGVPNSQIPNSVIDLNFGLYYPM